MCNYRFFIPIQFPETMHPSPIKFAYPLFLIFCVFFFVFFVNLKRLFFNFTFLPFDSDRLYNCSFAVLISFLITLDLNPIHTRQVCSQLYKNYWIFLFQNSTIFFNFVQKQVRRSTETWIRRQFIFTLNICDPGRWRFAERLVRMERTIIMFANVWRRCFLSGATMPRCWVSSVFVHRQWRAAMKIIKTTFSSSNGSPRCTGGNKKYFSCNTQVCIEWILFSIEYGNEMHFITLFIVLLQSTGLPREWSRFQAWTVFWIRRSTIWRDSIRMGAIFKGTKSMRTELHATRWTILL